MSKATGNAGASVSSVADVLVVEDNPVDFELTRAALEALTLPIRVHHAPDGEAALAFLERRGPHADAPRPDLVLLDLNLPGIEGHEVLQRLKASDALSTIPVVVLTASEALEDVREAYGHHANGFLSKPGAGPALDEMWRALGAFWLSIVKPAGSGRGGSTAPYRDGASPLVLECPARILYVEDDPLDQELVLEAAATLFEHPIDVVPDAAAALSRLYTHSPAPDVVLLDFGLPGASGMDLLRAIRVDARFARIQVVGFTGSEDDRTVAEAYRGHVNAFIPKPVDPDDIFRFMLGIAHWYSFARTDSA